MEEEGITVPSFRGLPTPFWVHEPCRPDRIRRSLLQFQFPRGIPASPFAKSKWRVLLLNLPIKFAMQIFLSHILILIKKYIFILIKKFTYNHVQKYKNAYVI